MKMKMILLPLIMMQEGMKQERNTCKYNRKKPACDEECSHCPRKSQLNYLHLGAASSLK